MTTPFANADLTANRVHHFVSPDDGLEASVYAERQGFRAVFFDTDAEKAVAIKFYADADHACRDARRFLGIAQCDVCGEMRPDCRTIEAYGIETVACARCRHDDD